MSDEEVRAFYESRSAEGATPWEQLPEVWRRAWRSVAAEHYELEEQDAPKPD